ncbi:hypothetical protein BDY21DRAFT_353607 [Lineolata rhizophorae]|uniref:Uncharacterized protein n=1 Tax=Lineolata rhizophorae TaxID=578093 RepID=A0A6A6NRG9_9PEZI|nr:hypothetical protein BDY21DRAFT_353607 [Lineolata rhizophorae]
MGCGDLDAKSNSCDSQIGGIDFNADFVLQKVDVQESEYELLRIWREESYRISVDQCSTVEVPDVYSWNCFLVEEIYHPAIDRLDGWWYGPDTLTKPNGKCILPPQLPRGKSSKHHGSVLIPSIPAYLNALDYHTTEYRHSKPALSQIGSWQIRNLTRYLYLELPHQQNTLLFELEAKTNEFLFQYLKHYKRKPRYVPVDEGARVGGLMLVKEWDPETYPDYIRRRFTGLDSGNSSSSYHNRSFSCK